MRDLHTNALGYLEAVPVLYFYIKLCKKIGVVFGNKLAKRKLCGMASKKRKKKVGLKYKDKY